MSDDRTPDKVWWRTEDGIVRLRSQDGKCPAIVFIGEEAYGLTLDDCKALHSALDQIIVQLTFAAGVAGAA